MFYEILAVAILLYITFLIYNRIPGNGPTKVKRKHPSTEPQSALAFPYFDLKVEAELNQQIFQNIDDLAGNFAKHPTQHRYALNEIDRCHVQIQSVFLHKFEDLKKAKEVFSNSNKKMDEAIKGYSEALQDYQNFWNKSHPDDLAKQDKNTHFLTGLRKKVERLKAQNAKILAIELDR